MHDEELLDIYLSLLYIAYDIRMYTRGLYEAGNIFRVT
jgi:hypothetical protein